MIEIWARSLGVTIISKSRKGNQVINRIFNDIASFSNNFLWFLSLILMKYFSFFELATQINCLSLFQVWNCDNGRPLIKGSSPRVQVNSLNDEDRTICHRACMICWCVTDRACVPWETQLRVILAEQDGFDTSVASGTGPTGSERHCPWHSRFSRSSDYNYNFVSEASSSYLRIWI